MLLKLNYQFINFSIIIKLHIAEASMDSVHKDWGKCSVNQKVLVPTYICSN